MISRLSIGADAAATATALEALWAEGSLVGLASPPDWSALAAALPPRLGTPSPWGPGVVIASGGSSGRRGWCVQPLAGLERAAAAAALWLQAQGLDPASATVFNPLPLQHVSGLMPLVRGRRWGAELRWLEPALMREPEALAGRAPLPDSGAALLSLVPTQLQRLLGDPAGIAWLRGFAVVWIGGAALAPALAAAARRAGVPLSPCYGSTETGAMVTALAPGRFLAGEGGCGHPLAHAQVRLDPASGALQVKATSLSPGAFDAGAFQPLEAPEGWWSSGDGGRLSPAGLELLGRLDGALSSGGETVFPEEVEGRLRALAAAADLPLQAVLVLGQNDPLWGQRLVALVRAQSGADASALVAALERVAAVLPPAQRPRSWLLCPELAPNGLGKWERGRWGRWLREAPRNASSDGLTQ
ncbi:AMP-binding protein [Cyanobium sp. Morenito 9A2]|uniref:AMP-binding protein n=1 Tax=Cyanobium sp. Morenito 9A2 TaxID=2823718 RepID=UPI0020CBF836|nr:AMP-binding protein [Cyanobium sp. Morenito 9A2]